MRKLIALLFIICCTTAFGQNPTLYFEKNEFKLDAKDINILNELAIKLKSEKNTNQIGIIGHTDTDATEKYNERLAFKRAGTVRNHLLSLGIHNKISMLSKGEKNTVNANETEAQKQLNRRVEIITDFEVSSKSNNHFHQECDREAQVFTIDPRLGGELTTKHGIVVTIDPRSFDTKLFATPIDIHIKEYVKKDHFVRGNLTTTTGNGEIIESRGMVKIDAIQKGEFLDLKKGNTVDVYFPDRKVNDGTELFIANRESQDRDLLWRLAPKVITRTNSTTFVDGRQEGGETNWYQEGPYVRRTRWHLDQKGKDVYKISKTDIKGKITRDTVLLTVEEVIEILTFPSSQLGWINCDRFYRDPAEKVNISIHYDADPSTDFYLVFDDMYSVLPFSYRENNHLIYTNVPEGKNVTIVAIHKKDNEEMVKFSSKKMVTRKDMEANLTFEEITREELEERLSAL